MWKQTQSDPTALDNALWAVILWWLRKLKAHHSGKVDTSYECQGHLYLEGQRRSLEEVTLKLSNEKNNGVTKPKR